MVGLQRFCSIRHLQRSTPDLIGPIVGIRRARACSVRTRSMFKLELSRKLNRRRMLFPAIRRGALHRQIPEMLP